MSLYGGIPRCEKSQKDHRLKVRTRVRFRTRSRGRTRVRVRTRVKGRYRGAAPRAMASTMEQRRLCSDGLVLSFLGNSAFRTRFASASNRVGMRSQISCLRYLRLELQLGLELVEDGFEKDL